MRAPERERISSYGLDRSVTSWVARPASVTEVVDCIGLARDRGWSICPAGGRNSFGDVFLLGDHLSVDLRGLDRVLDFDTEAGTITVEGGALEGEVMALSLAAGWYLPASSGSLWNTVAGCLSSNINGKDSWHAGTFGEQVVSLRIALADGSVRCADRQRDRELFEAAIGGLGLLGIVTEVTLRLRPAPSVTVEQSSQPIAGAEALGRSFAALRPDTDLFAYAWVDPYARGESLGRAVFEAARFATDGERPSLAELRPRLAPPLRIAGLPPAAFWAVVSRGWKVLRAAGLDASAFRLMSRVKYALAVRGGARDRRVDFPRYQYPMTRLFPHWNLKFAPEGFHEVQVLLPAERFAGAAAALFDFCDRRGRVPEVVAARRHRADPYPLSFAGDGLSLTLPFPLAGFTAGALDDFRRALIDEILRHGGKVYLSKFPYLGVDAFRAMYPGWRAFAAVKARVDPDRLFWSEAAARLLA